MLQLQDPQILTIPKKHKDPLTLSCLLITPLLSLLLLLSLSLSSSSSSSSSSSASSSTTTNPPLPFPTHQPTPPSLAYLLSGTQSTRLYRLLLSVYHPKNTYLLYLLNGDQENRETLAKWVGDFALFRAVGNVHVIGKPGFGYKDGSSEMAATLHGVAVLLKIGMEWDWFVNLDADRDYPLVTQDDLLHVFSFLPRELNFVQHGSYIGWRESRKLKPIIVDPGLYLSSKAEMFYATQKRDLPNAYRLFTGSPSVILSRKFIEHCILGTDNLPRILLMYYANTPSSHTAYFQTLLCNSPEFNQTIINDNLHYVKWDTPTKREPRVLNLDDLNNMTQSGAAFGTGFSKDNASVLDHIDREILNHDDNDIVKGGWCIGGLRGDQCTTWGAVNVLKPGPGAMRLVDAVVKMLSDERYHSNRCIWDASM